jgi:hypothetical protein
VLRDALSLPETAAATSAALEAARHLPIRVPFALGPDAPAPAPAAMRAIGPFIDADGLLRWIDLLEPKRKITVKQSGVAEPAFFLTAARLPAGSAAPYVIRLRAGTVWIRARLLDPAAPAGAFAGIRVTGGTLRAGVSASVAGDVVTVSQLDIQLELLPEPTPIRAVTPSGAAAAASITIELPARATFVWRGGALSRVDADAGIAEGWNQRFRFTRASGTKPRHVPALDHILVPFDCQPPIFRGGDIQSPLVDVSGDAAVASAGWAVPLTRVANPSALGEANGAGGWLLSGAEGLAARWLDNATDTVLRAHHALFNQNRFTLLAERTVPRKPAVTDRLSLWSLEHGSSRRARLELRRDAEDLLGYQCDVADGEVLVTRARAIASVDRPVGADGVPVALPTGRAIVALLNRGQGIEIDVLIPRDPLAQVQVTSIILDNAHLRVRGAALSHLHGALDGTSVLSGTLITSLDLAAWTPILPDPYAASVRSGRGDVADAARARVTATVDWTSSRVILRFAGDPSTPSGTGRATSQARPRPLREVSQSALPRTQTRDGAMLELRGAGDTGRFRAEDAAGAVTTTATLIGGGFRGSQSGFLLDVSTNRDLLGVQLGFNARGFAALAQTHQDQAVGSPLIEAGGSPFRLDGLSVVTPAANLRLFTVPQIQWEPVRTLDIDQDVARLGWFPTPLASATDGGPTIIANASMRLLATVPDVAVERLLTDFAAGSAAFMVTTLPFGLMAQVQLQPRAAGARQADTIALTRPVFKTLAMRGGAQITMRAEGGVSRPGEQSPTFAGATVQILNGVDLMSGTPLGISVLGATKDSAGSVESLFNTEFSPGKPTARVPVTRFDVSGYGGSNFSDWANPRGLFAQATKVQFQVIVGRTALEIVKVASVLYPWGVRVTRSVTIERRGGGGIIRRDSGWKASSHGLFDFRHDGKPSPYVFQPGLLRGCFDVDDIRPADGRVIAFTGSDGSAVRLLAQLFDANVELDGLIAPGGARSVRARGLLGFLHLEPVGKPITPDDLARLVEQESSIGGPVDALIDVGASGLLMRAFRVEVDVAKDGATPNFVGAVRGMPSLPPTGAWSAVRQATAGNPAAPGDAAGVDERRGLPLIRARRMADPVGNQMQFTGAAGDYRFADPEDLFVPAAPAFDYGFLQTTPTHAFLFRRPHIAAGVRELRSTLAPHLADIIASYTSKAAFPPLANAIALPVIALPINAATGRFRLPSPVVMGPPLRPRLQLTGSGVNGLALHYDRAGLRFELDDDKWRFEMTKLQSWSDMAGISKLVGAEYHIVGGTQERSQVRTIESLIQEDLEDVLSFLPWFADRDPGGPVDLDATNKKHEKKIEVGIKIAPKIPKIEFELSTLFLLAHKAGGRDAKEEDHDPKPFASEAKLELKLQGYIPVLEPINAIVGGSFEAAMKPSETELEIQGFFGIGVKGEIGPFEAKAYLATGIVVVIVVDPPPTIYKVGGLVRFGAEIDFVVASASIEAEIKGVFFKKADVWYYEATGELVISISIAIIFSIEFSVEYTKEMESPL